MRRFYSKSCRCFWSFSLFLGPLLLSAQRWLGGLPCTFMPFSSTGSPYWSRPPTASCTGTYWTERRRERDCNRKRQGWPQRRGDAQGVQVETDQTQRKEDALQSKQVFPTSFYVHCIHTVITPKWWNVLGSIEQRTKIAFPPIETQGLCGLSSPTRNWTWATAEKALSSNHQTAREVPSRSESGIEPGPWQRTRWVLTTGLPGKSPQDHVWDHIYVNIFQYQQFF